MFSSASSSGGWWPSARGTSSSVARATLPLSATDLKQYGYPGSFRSGLTEWVFVTFNRTGTDGRWVGHLMHCLKQIETTNWVTMFLRTSHIPFRNEIEVERKKEFDHIQEDHVVKEKFRMVVNRLASRESKRITVERETTKVLHEGFLI